MTELDTDAIMTDFYKHYRTGDQLHATVAALGFDEIEWAVAGNGVEMRARYCGTRQSSVAGRMAGAPTS
jgi:hypothetical protein